MKLVGNRRTTHLRMLTAATAAVPAGLSPLYAERVWLQIDRIRATGVALLVVEQNASLAMDHADSVYLLAQGRNVLSGSASEMREHAEVAGILVG